MSNDLNIDIEKAFALKMKAHPETQVGHNTRANWLKNFYSTIIAKSRRVLNK